MGRLLKPRGLRGELRTAIFNENGSTLKVETEIWLKKEEEYFSRKIKTIKMAGEKSCIRLSGCNTLEDAEKVQGAWFFLPRDEFDPIGENEHYLVDMIGSQVMDENQKLLGSVTNVLAMPAQNIIVVETGKNEILIPYVDAHIVLFEKQKNNLIVKDVEGLIN
jgi:16S rRNA processing protein RimM